MIEDIEALIALKRTGSMSKAATELRLSQPAISKRIASLERQAKNKLVQKVGRGVELTAEGEEFVQRISPIIAELRTVLKSESAMATLGRLEVGVSESILGSWGSSALRKADESFDSRFSLHAHRSPTVIDRVKSGEYIFGLVAGEPTRDGGLIVESCGMEPMVLLSRGETKKKIITIESGALTWEQIRKDAAQMKIDQRVESFFAVAQLALNGWGVGLLPLGVANAMKSRGAEITKPKGLKRTISLVCRKGSLSRPQVAQLFESIKAAVRRELENLE